MPPIILTDADIPALLPARPANANKGTFGRVRVLAGCRHMPGAAALCCAAAYRMGAGLVEACTVAEAAHAVNFHVPEAVTPVLPGTDGGYGPESFEALRDFKDPDIWLLGPGIGQGEAVRQFVYSVLENTRVPVIIDADGLNNIAEEIRSTRNVGLLSGLTAAVTPHPGEMSRLTGISINEIINDMENTAASFARHYGITVLLKGPRTVIAGPNGEMYINTTGNTALAKAGSGDALAGMIAGLAAQGTALTKACALGAFLHGKAGEYASRALSLYGVNASDVIRALPKVLLGFTPPYQSTYPLPAY
jgi:NAD(P)H-hydrate epimerase